MSIKKHFFYSRKKNYKGSALLTVLVLMATALIVTTTSVAVIAVNMSSTTRQHISEEALAVAESGIDNAILRLLRDESYTGEVLPVGNGSAVVTVSGSGVKTIVSTGTVQSMTRKLQIQGTFSGTIFSINSWSEVP